MTTARVSPATVFDGFGSPYVDVDEWRETPHPHHYLHGGFSGNETRFSYYFPAQEDYRGRFVQHVTPMPDSEHLAPPLTGSDDKIGFAFSIGGYFVETNGGGAVATPGGDTDPTIGAYRANAAAAEFARTVARRLYGEHRPFGYLYGGSGGGYRTLGGAEGTTGIWDGFVPYVIGSPMAIPNVFSVRMHAQRVLRDRLDGIVDAVEPGGTGDPFKGLDDEQAAALLEVTRMGFPLRSWFGHRTMGTQAFSVLYPTIKMIDGEYFELFWKDSGYLGADPTSSVHRDRVEHTTDAAAVLRRRDQPDLGPLADPFEAESRSGVDESFKGKGDDRLGELVVAVRLATPPSQVVQTAELRVTSGEAAGTTVMIKGVFNDLAVIDFPDRYPELGQLAAGDQVEIDNCNVLAAQTYHRHQVPGPEYAVYDQFRGPDRTPLYPQRPFLLGPRFCAAAAGHVPTGDFEGKMIVVEALLDREAFPWQADWYRARAVEHQGAEVEHRLRVWYVDNALHGDVEVQEDAARTVGYVGVLQQALRALAEWVENGTPPPASTRYAIVEGQVEVPPKASERLGVQPVVELTADGGSRSDVELGAEVHVSVHAEVPSGAGTIVKVQWDLDGDGVFEITEHVEPAAAVDLARSVRVHSTGTRFVTVRVSSQPDGDTSTPFGVVDNVARARVVVA